MEEAEKVYEAGLEELKKGNFDEAIRKIKNALEMDPKDPYYHNDLSFAYLRLGQLDNAYQECETALALDPNHPSANMNKMNLLQIKQVFKASDLLVAVEIVKDIIERPIGYMGNIGSNQGISLVFKDYSPRIIFTSPNPKTVFIIEEYPIEVPLQSEIMYTALKTEQGWVIGASVDMPATEFLVTFSTIADEPVKNSMAAIRLATNNPSLELTFKKMLFVGSNINHKVFESEMGIIDSITTREKDGTRGVIKFRGLKKTINFFHYLPSGKIKFLNDLEDNPIQDKPAKPWYQFLWTQVQGWFQKEPDKVQIISMEEINRGRPHTPAEINSIHFIADAAGSYQNSIHVLLKSGTKKEWVQKIIDESESLFPDQFEQSFALAFLSELESYAIKPGADKDGKYDFNDYGPSLLQDTARENYYVAARIVKTLIPVDIWLEHFYFQKPQNNIPRLFHTSNLLYRLDQIKDIKDQKMLCEIARADENPWCRMMAIEKIDDESVLYEIASTELDKNIAKAAIGKIDKQSMLINLVTVATSSDIRIIALQKINNESSLLEIAQTSNDVRIWKDAIKNINSVKGLKQFIATCKDADKRAYAVTQINNDEPYMIEIANNDIDAHVRTVAVKRIVNQVELERIVKNDVDAKVRAEAADRITDQVILVQTAEIAVDARVRAVAVNKITDQVELVRIANSDNDVIVQRAAANKITDQTILLELVKTQKDGLTRSLIAEKISEENLLIDLAINHPDMQIALIAVKKISDQAFLARIAKEGRFPTIRVTAVSNISDQHLLADIAQTAEDEQVFLEALNKITDANILSNLNIH